MGFVLLFNLFRLLFVLGSGFCIVGSCLVFGGFNFWFVWLDCAVIVAAEMGLLLYFVGFVMFLFICWCLLCWFLILFRIVFCVLFYASVAYDCMCGCKRILVVFLLCLIGFLANNVCCIGLDRLLFTLVLCFCFNCYVWLLV